MFDVTVSPRESERRRDQRVDVDLRATAEDDAVVIDQINRAFSLDLAEDLARYAGGDR